MEYQWFDALKNAIAGNRQPQSRYVQMATLGLDGAPRNRTLVFRGFLAGASSPLFVADNRSEKISELIRNNRCELSWYFPESWEQFRLRGEMQVLSAAYDKTALRADIWQGLSDAIRAQFYWSSPGGLRTDSNPLNTRFVVDAPNLPPQTFNVLALTVTAADHLQLQPTQRRFCSELAPEGWHSREIHP